MVEAARGIGQGAVVEHGGVRFAVEAVAPDRWEIREPSGRVVGTLGVESRAGEEGGTVYIGRPLGSDAWVDGTDWHGIALAVVNEAAGIERERVDVNPAADHVRGGIISRRRSDVGGLS